MLVPENKLSEAEEIKRDKNKFGALSKLEKEIYEDVKGFYVL